MRDAMVNFLYHSATKATVGDVTCTSLLMQMSCFVPLQPTIASRYKYPVESHTAITKDKYVLEMHRIPHGKDEDPPPEGAAPRPVVFIQHGLLTSSADFSIAGPGKALGEILR